MDNNIINDEPKQFQTVKLSLKHDRNIACDFVCDTLEKMIYVINDFLCDSPNEQLLVIGLDRSNVPRGCSVVGMGSDCCIDIDMYFKNVFRFLLLTCSDKFVLVHNHNGSGNMKPSDGDVRALTKINDYADKLGFTFHDFIIVGNDLGNRAYWSQAKKKIITHYDFLKHINSKSYRKSILNVSDEVDGAEKLRQSAAANDPEQEDKFYKKPEKSKFFGLF